MCKALFTSVMRYVSSFEGQPFESYEEAEAAYGKHLRRMGQKSLPLTEIKRAYWRALWDRCRISMARHGYFYKFGDIKHVLKKHRLWGQQVFDCGGSDDTTCIYSRDGVTIDVCYSYGYYEVKGLRPWDFAKLEEAYREREEG